MNTISRLAVVSALALLIAGCHPSATTGGSNETPAKSAAKTFKAYDPCELITKQDIEEAFGAGWGVKPKDGTDKPANSAGQRICGYVPDAGSKAPEFFMAQIDVTSEESMAPGARQGGVTAESQYEAIKKIFEPQGITQLAGIGDAAWDGGCVIGKGGLRVLVKDKGVYFSISSIFSEKGCAEEQAAWKALAQKLISRL